MLIEHTLFGVVDKVNDAIFLLKKYEPADGYWVYYIKALQTIIDNRIKNGEKLRRYDNGVDWFYNWIDRSYNWKSKLYATNGDSLFPTNI